MTTPAVVKPVLAGCSLFVLRGAEFLMLRRAGSHGAGCWALPGGKIDFGETVSQAAARECREEVGLVVRPEDIALGPVTNDIFLAEDKHFLNVWCSVVMPEDQQPRNMEPHKASDLAWFTWDTLPAPLFTPVRSFQTQPLRPPFGARDSRPASDFEHNE